MPSSSAASSEAKLNPQDKENIKSVMEMFGTEHDQAYIKRVYLMNNRNLEKTIDNFCSGELPAKDSEPQLAMIETAPVTSTSTMIDTGAQHLASSNDQKDLRSYVLDEYKEMLFPKQQTKYEKAQADALQRKQQREENESVEVRKKILALA